MGSYRLIIISSSLLLVSQTFVEAITLIVVAGLCTMSVVNHLLPTTSKMREKIPTIWHSFPSWDF